MWFLTALLDVLKSIEQAVLNASPLSAQALLDLIKTVDGSGSGLDADLVDGRDDIIYEVGADSFFSYFFTRGGDNPSEDAGTGLVMKSATNNTIAIVGYIPRSNTITYRTDGSPGGVTERAGIALSISLDTPLEEKQVSYGNYDAVAGMWAMAEALGSINNAGTFAIRASDGWVSYSGGRFEMAISGGKLRVRSAMSGDYALTVQFVGAGN